MTGTTLPKVLAVAAIGLTAVVGVMAEADAMGPMDDHDDDEHDHGKMETELKAVGYKGYMGVDYVPIDAMDPVASDIEGTTAGTALECAMECDMVADCNGASFYPDPETFFGTGITKNCWLKTFSDTCMLPAEHVDEMGVILLMKPTADCPEDAHAGHDDDEHDDDHAEGPMGADSMAEGPVSTTRDFDMTEDTVTDVASSMSARSAAAALAVAGAILALA